PFGSAQGSGKPKVMVLGTYHMANPGLDYVRTKIRDTLSPERQAEMQLLLSRLARFEPTKIAVELVSGSRIAERYTNYVKGKVELSSDEIEQIGFRLGKAMGHSQLYPVDCRGDMDFEGLKRFAEEARQIWFLEKLERFAKDAAQRQEEMDRRYTIAQMLAVMNSTKSLAYHHSIYIDMLRVGDEENCPGVEVVAGWYRRNLAIYANIRRIVQSASDRILVLYGAGHAKLLGDFVCEADDLEFVDPLDYLPEVPGQGL
ncbi:MAG TPA: DUF5694 domain-containing protein, partial [Fimbriimonadaceae bacterium]|nr:DUF5694 domain-containing protein [Fimbriimonadaceae bacterium]